MSLRVSFTARTVTLAGAAALAATGAIGLPRTAAADIDCTPTIFQSSVHATPASSAMTAKGSTSISVSAVVQAPCGNPAGTDLFPTINLSPVDIEHNRQWETGIAVVPWGAHRYHVSKTGAVKAATTANADAGTWDVTVGIIDTDDPGEYDLTTYSDPVYLTIRRAASISANAAPEPVKKGRTITVRGKLTRANWDTGQSATYGKQPVRLQFRTSSGSYATVTTAHSSSTGAVKATVKATKDGFYRFVYAGSATTSSTTSAGDYVNVT